MVIRPNLSEPVGEELEDIMDEYGYNSYEQAIRKALQEMGRDV